jgi:hypothetical protein
VTGDFLLRFPEAFPVAGFLDAQSERPSRQLYLKKWSLKIFDPPNRRRRHLNVCSTFRITPDSLTLWFPSQTENKVFVHWSCPYQTGQAAAG